MDIDLRKLNHLVTVAQTGSFSRAAAELHITQPALSRSIASVESQFGVKVFDRSRSGAALTPAGRLVIEEAELLLRRAKTLSQNMKLYRSGDAGEVVFGMGPMVGSLVLPSLSSFFMTQQPRLHINAAVKSATTLLDELRNEKIEMLFCGLGQMGDAADINIDIVGKIPLALLVRSQHPLCQLDTITQTDLFQYPILSAVEMPAANAAGRAGGTFICDNYDILRSTVLHSDGIWISSPHLVKDEIAQGLITTIAASDLQRPSVVEVCMTHLEGRELSPAATAIVRFVRDYFDKHGL